MVNGLAQVQATAAILTDPAAVLGYRVIGAAAGTTLAFLVAWPKGRFDFLVRLVASMIVGVVFAFQVREYLNWPLRPERIVAAATVTAFFGWAALGLGVVLFDKFGAEALKRLTRRS